MTLPAHREMSHSPGHVSISVWSLFTATKYEPWVSRSLVRGVFETFGALW